MAVQAGQLHMLGRHRLAHRLEGLARLERKAEFRIDLTRADELVRVRVDARLDAHRNARRNVSLCGKLLDAPQLRAVVHHYVADAALDRVDQLGHRFVISLEMDAVSYTHLDVYKRQLHICRKAE